MVGAAQSPHITPQGNLLYLYYTAHGYKNFGLSKNEFMNEDATEHFNTSPDSEEVAAFMASEEDLSHYADVTVPSHRGAI